MIALENISWQTKEFRLKDLSMTVPSGCYGVLMGRTGCGKTTLAEILCGLRHPTAGKVRLGDRDVTDLPPGQRGIGYVPQDGALFPTMSVADNIGFALRVRGVRSPVLKHAVEDLARQLGILHLLSRNPEHLSGGEKQRVALGRALIAEPSALILDEPLSALDDATRDELVSVLKGLHNRFSVTVLHITHHRYEARELADRLFKLENGVIFQEPSLP